MRIYEAQAQRLRRLAAETSDPELRRLLEEERAFWVGLQAESRAIADFTGAALPEQDRPPG